MIKKIKHRQSRMTNLSVFKKKAAFFDELVVFIEDKLFGGLLQETESEQNIPLNRAVKFLD